MVAQPELPLFRGMVRKRGKVALFRDNLKTSINQPNQQLFLDSGFNTPIYAVISEHRSWLIVFTKPTTATRSALRSGIHAVLFWLWLAVEEIVHNNQIFRATVRDIFYTGSEQAVTGCDPYARDLFIGEANAYQRKALWSRCCRIHAEAI